MTDAHLLITENIDVWTTAIKKRSATGRGSNKKIELTGIKKLRELILELAVRGQLVPQDPNDEPASVLLEKIATEKAQLIKDKKIKKQKPLPAITKDEKPFALPSGWGFEKLGHLAIQITDGVHHTPKYLDDGIPFISVKDINGKKISFDNCKYISQEQHEEINLRCNPKLGDVLICRIGTLGRVTLVDTEQPFSLFVSVGLIKFLQKYYLPEFSHLVLHSPFLTNQYDAIKAGGSHTNKLNLGDLPRLVLPISPLPEQHRIVTKVDELMGLCDQLEQQTEDSITAHKTLVETLLATLTNSENAEEFQQNWARIAEHFDTLFTTEHSIDQLKKTVLQLAVMGKLVPQNPNDESASVLLEKIAAEKEQLIKDKKIKKQKPLPAITEDEKPFDLPNGWEWVRFGRLFKSFTNGLYKPSKFYTDQGLISLRMYNIQNGQIDFSAAKRVELEPKELEQFLLEENDLLINRVNSKELVGKTAIIPAFQELLVYESMNMRAKPFKNYISAHYLNLFMMSQLAKGSISSFAKEAIGQASINQSQVSSIKTPFPPLLEQHRIVKKVDELLTLCDQLKDKLSDAQTTQLQLAETIVKQAVN